MSDILTPREAISWGTERLRDASETYLRFLGRTARAAIHPIDKWMIDGAIANIPYGALEFADFEFEESVPKTPEDTPPAEEISSL